jgi:hypothetical protein
MRSWTSRQIRRGLLLSSLAAIGLGCGPRDTGSGLSSENSTRRENPEANRVIQEGLNEIVNGAEIRYKPLEYEYDEGLLRIADQAESSLAGQATGVLPRFMPRLDEVEERDHIRATIHSWEVLNGRPFRAAIDPLIAEVTDRKPGEGFHPDFHKRFGLVFDSFISIEVKDARERRNRAIRTKADELLAQYRLAEPRVVKDFEAMLTQQYPLASPTPIKP